MSDQKAEEFETPERKDIPGITRGHVAAMEASVDGEPEEVWVMFNMAHLLLRTIGRRSGRVHKVALPYWIDTDGSPIVVGSFAGAPKHPAWYLNLTDRSQWTLQARRHSNICFERRRGITRGALEGRQQVKIFNSVLYLPSLPLFPGFLKSVTACCY